jgi:Zn-dependent protease with chaperone function
MDSTAVKFGAVFLGLGVLTFVVLVAVLGGVGPCTDMPQLVLLIIALSGILIGGAILFISLLVRAVRRFKEYKAGDVGSLFPKSDKKSDSF